MHSAETLHDLRPKDDTAAAIEAAIAAADARRQAGEARVKDVSAKWRALLLAGTDAEIDAAEADLAQANREVSRAAAVAQSLAAQLPHARRGEAVAEVVLAVHEANEAAVAFKVWLEETYPGLAAAMLKGLLMETAAIEAYRRARATQEKHKDGVTAADLPAPLFTASGALAGSGHWADVFGKRVSLPLPVTDARLFGQDMAWKPDSAGSYSW